MTWGEIVTTSDWSARRVAIVCAVRSEARRQGCAAWEVIVNGRVVRRGKV